MILISFQLNILLGNVRAIVKNYQNERFNIFNFMLWFLLNYIDYESK